MEVAVLAVKNQARPGNLVGFSNAQSFPELSAQVTVS